MRILLVQSYLGRKEKPIYPLGLAYLSSMLQNHEVKIVDPNILDDPIAGLKTAAREFQPDFAGVSLRNADTTQIKDPYVYLPGFRQTLDALKESIPDTPILAGGAGFSIYAREVLKLFPQIDIGVFLEAEDCIFEIADKWPNIDDISGLFIRRDNEIHFTGTRVFNPISELPFPDWDKAPVAPYKDFLDAVGVQTKRGCGLKCAYCNYPFLSGSCYRFRDPESVGEEIERLVKDHGVEKFVFVDSVFNIPRDHCESVLREIIRRKIKVKWTGWYNERNLDRELIDLAVAAGCELFSFSPDGFSDQSLKALGKNLRKNDILRVFDLMKDTPQALVYYNFFMNPPKQTIPDLLKLFAFNLKVRRTFGGRMVGFALNSIRIEPDTPIYETALQEGVIDKGTPLAVESNEELQKLFYKPANSTAVNALMRLYISLWKLKRKIKPVPETEDVTSGKSPRSLLVKDLWGQIRTKPALIFGREFQSSPPYFINLEPTCFCNLNCKICSYDGSRKKGHLTPETALLALDQAQELGVTEIRFFLAGEPFFNPHLAEYINMAKERGFITNIHSNATFMPEERIKMVLDAGLDRMSFSFDGETEEEYEKIRIGGNFQATLANIINFLKIKQKRGDQLPVVTIQVIKLAESPNCGIISDEFKEKFTGLPVDEFRLLNPFVWPDQDRQKFNRPHGHKYFPCWIPWSSLSLGWDGRVVWCCGDLNGKGILGDIRKQTLREIWNGNEIRRIRRGLSKGKLDDLELCKNCEAVYHKYHPVLIDIKDYLRQIKRVL